MNIYTRKKRTMTNHSIGSNSRDSEFMVSLVVPIQKDLHASIKQYQPFIKKNQLRA